MFILRGKMSYRCHNRDSTANLYEKRLSAPCWLRFTFEFSETMIDNAVAKAAF